MSAEPLRRLDGLLTKHASVTLRFAGDKQEPALLAPISVFTALSRDPHPSAIVTGEPGKDPAAEVLFLASPRAVSDIQALMDLIARQGAGKGSTVWVGIPENAIAELPDKPLLGSQAGTLELRDKGQTSSFALYPLLLRQESPGLRPASVKLPEPEGNLRARSEWFQSRSGRRKR